MKKPHFKALKIPTEGLHDPIQAIIQSHGAGGLLQGCGGVDGDERVKEQQKAWQRDKYHAE